MTHLPRFVILHHQVPADDARAAVPEDRRAQPLGSHFDWMFDAGDHLKTWATEITPSLELPFEIDAFALADHRRAYLDYEGEISGGRGWVRQIVRGTYETTAQTESGWSGQLWWSDAGDERTAAWSLYRRCLADSDDDLARAAWRLRLSPWR